MPMTLLVVADAASGPSIPWLTPTIALLTLLLGGGGIAALLKVRHDKRLGVAQQEAVEDDALSNRWRAIIETQTKVLLEPMKLELQEVKTEVRGLRADLETSRRKYWAAISYIRTLYNWMARHLPDDVEQTQIPAPPTVVVEDI